MFLPAALRRTEIGLRKAAYTEAFLIDFPVQGGICPGTFRNFF